MSGYSETARIAQSEILEQLRSLDSRAEAAAAGGTVRWALQRAITTVEDVVHGATICGSCGMIGGHDLLGQPCPNTRIPCREGEGCLCGVMVPWRPGHRA
jgi:hypothetical protein